MTQNLTEPATTAAARRTSKARRSRRVVPWLGGLVVIGLLTAGFWPRAIPVETTRVTIGTLQASVNEEGKTRIRQRYVISSPVMGQLRRIPLKAGADVHANETVVAVVDPAMPVLLDARRRASAEARRDAASANVEKARSSHEFVASELRRFDALYKSKTISVQELESVQMRESSLARELAAAESTLKEAEAELAESQPMSEAPDTNRPPKELRSPVNGKILRVFEENARVVTPGLPLAEIGDPTDLEVVVDVLSRDGATILPGYKVELEQWGGGQPLEAKVRLVEPAAFTKVSALGVEEQRVNVIADMVTPPEQRLTVGDSFRVEARIIVWEAQNTLKVPSGAVFRRGEEWGCYVVKDGRVHLRSVKIGRGSGTETQILQGLSEKEELVLYPGNRVHEGDKVKAITL